MFGSKSAAKTSIAALTVTVGAYGTRNIDEVLDLLDEGLVDTKAALKDGKISPKDILEYRGMVEKVGPAIEGLNQIKNEIWDLQAQELTHVILRVGALKNKYDSLFPKAA